MKLPSALAILAISGCFFGCQSGSNQTIPDALVGEWKTSAPGYEDNSLELRKDEILFGVGQSAFSANSIFKVETVRQSDGKTSLITIYYTDPDGKDNAASIYYDPTGAGSLRFKNQLQIEWKRFAQKPGGEGFRSRRRSALYRWRRFDLSTAVMLLGVALTASASLWRLQAAKGRKGGRYVGKIEVGSAQEMEGGRESGERRVAEGGTDWTQAPAAVPAIVARERRRSERILLKVPVHVEGIDVDGNSFAERTFTLAINRDGAIVCLKSQPRQGDQVALTNLGTFRKSAFRLCESSKDSSSEVTAWGIECLEPNSNFWHIRFPEKPPELSLQETITALVVCASCRSREVADLSVAQYRKMLDRGSMRRDCSDCGAATEWNFVLVDGTAAASPEVSSTASLPSGEENRREKRIVAKLPIRLRHPEDGRVEDTVTENVSKSGVCCAASMELSVDEGILLTFESGAGPSKQEHLARIMWRRPLGGNRKSVYGIRLERRES